LISNNQLLFRKDFYYFPLHPRPRHRHHRWRVKGKDRSPFTNGVRKEWMASGCTVTAFDRVRLSRG